MLFHESNYELYTLKCNPEVVMWWAWWDPSKSDQNLVHSKIWKQATTWFYMTHSQIISPSKTVHNSHNIQVTDQSRNLPASNIDFQV